MNLELRHFELFAVVAEHGSFSAAGKHLGMSQPSVSRAVAAIEGRLGVRLVTRTTRRFALTEAGATLARESARVLEAAQAARHRTIRAARDRRIVLGVKPDSAVGFTTELIRVCAAQQPPVRVRLHLLGAAELPPALRRGECDVALVAWPLTDDRLIREELWTEPRVAVLPAPHPLAATASLRMTDFLGQPAVRWPDLPEPVDRYFQGLDAAPGTTRGAGPAVSDLAAALRLVELGEAVTFLPRSVAARYARDSLAIREVDGLSPSCVQLVRAAPAETDDRLATFLRLCHDLAAEQSADTGTTGSGRWRREEDASAPSAVARTAPGGAGHR